MEIPLVELLETPLVELVETPFVELVETPLVELVETPLVELVETPLVELVETIALNPPYLRKHITRVERSKISKREQRFQFVERFEPGRQQARHAGALAGSQPGRPQIP